ncbi:MAG: glycosyltransferase family 2 protein [Actinobacteria bacterium]|nr:glycosyltransferase family 2 protein [Actinomycetota bacterium]
MRTAVVIPAFNEAEALPGVLAELAAAVPDHEVIVVDDGSSDGTVGVAAAAGVTCLRLPFNLGIGGALRLGFCFAAEEGFDRVYQFDADGQHDPSQIPVLLAGLENADMVVGTRFADGGESTYSVGRGRGFAMGLLRWLVRRATGRRFTDTSSGFRALRRPVLELFATDYPVEYMDSVEALLLAVRRGFTVIEVPVQMRERQGGQPSTRNLRLAYHYVRVLIVLAAGLGRRSRLGAAA